VRTCAAPTLRARVQEPLGTQDDLGEYACVSVRLGPCYPYCLDLRVMVTGAVVGHGGSELAIAAHLVAGADDVRSTTV
jgi:hypothetical protein